jgi:uncharacterized protein YcbK (DUF882 family)
LTTHGYKVWADDYAGVKDEFVGGRWNPRWNIMAAARALKSKLSGIPVNPSNIWLGVERYNGAGPAARAYAKDVRRMVEETYLPQVEESRTSATQQANVTGAPKNAQAASADDMKKLPDDVGRRSPTRACGWPHVHPDFYNLAVTVSRRFGCRIVNGYRSPACNSAVGGASKSDHLCGVACDYVGSGNQMAALARWANKQNYAMVIYGPLRIGPSEDWAGHEDHVHISFVRCSTLRRR